MAPCCFIKGDTAAEDAVSAELSPPSSHAATNEGREKKCFSKESSGFAFLLVLVSTM